MVRNLTLVALLSVLAGLLFAPVVFLSASALRATHVHADHNQTCHPKVNKSQGKVEYTWKIEEGVKGPTFDIDVFGSFNPEGKVIASGTASISDGTSNTILLAETRDASATCADTNEDGFSGLVELIVPFRHDRSSERVLATIIPEEGEIDESGQYPLTLRFAEGLGSYQVVLEIRFEVDRE